MHLEQFLGVNMTYQFQDLINLLICSVTLVCIAIFASVLFNKFHVYKYIPLPNRKSTIDGLRGYLALFVLIHHFILTFYWLKFGEWKTPNELYFQNLGKVGVAIFFIITGYLFIGKLFRDMYKIDVKALAISRFFRIMPLYFFTIIVVCLIVLISTNFEMRVNSSELLISLVRWLLFHGSTLNDFTDTRRVIAGVDWILKYEWLFYISLPLLAVFFRLNRYITTISLTVLIVFLYMKPVQFLAFNSVYLILFFIGGWVKFLENKVRIKNPDSRMLNILASLLLFSSILFFESLGFAQIMAISMFFMLIVSGTSLFGLLKADFSIFLGEISYSIYLLHGVCLYIIFSLLPIYSIENITLTSHLLFLPFMAFFVILLSTVTYILIEKPSMSYGKIIQVRKINPKGIL